MTKQELIKMMGDEDKANWAMDRILESVKPDFVLMVLKSVAKAAEKKYTEREESGYYEEFSHFPEGFSLWSEPEDSPLAKQFDNNRERESEQGGDKMYMNFTKNMYTHALWNKPEAK